jgi:hypothetical protein
MTFALTCKVVFAKNERRGEIVLHQVTAIEFESSYKDMTARGSVTIPRRKFFEKDNVKEALRRGDALTIYFGYDGKNTKEFEGYITEVSADLPIVIRFEDEMYQIKKLPVNFSAPNTTLENLLKNIMPGYKIDALEGVQLGGVRLPKTTVGPVLEKLRSDWGLYTFFRDGVVVSGKYTDSNAPIVKFHLERNCVSTSLNYRKKEDISLKIKCVSTLVNGEKIEVENIGDADGNERQLTFYNIRVKAELERLGRLEYEKYKQDRYDGTFTAFGIPSVKHGMKCDIKSTIYEERSGVYYIEKVVKTFDARGIRQDITIGEKV